MQKIAPIIDYGAVLFLLELLAYRLKNPKQDD